MVKHFLSKFGTAREIAALLQDISGTRCTETAVHQWPHQERIADKWAPWLARLAKKKRLAKSDVPAEVRRFMQ